MPRLLSTLLLPALLCLTASADVIHFQSGGLLHGRVIRTGTDRVDFDLLGGARYSCLKRFVDRVEHETDYDFHIKDGDYYLSKGLDAEAIRAYRRALRERAEDPVALARLDLVDFNRRMRKAESSISVAEKFLADQDFPKALAHYETALKISPSDPMTRDILDGMTLIYSRIAYFYYDHCFYSEAMANLTRAEQLNAERDKLSPTCAEIYYLLGMIEEDRGQLSAAKRQLEYALQLDPNHSKARDRLSEVIRAIRKSSS